MPCDDIMLACETLKTDAEAGDRVQAFEEEKKAQIKATYGNVLCCSFPLSACSFLRSALLRSFLLLCSALNDHCSD